MPKLEKYVIRGHGGVVPGRPKFTLGPRQYVIFPTKCGNPSSMGSMYDPRTRKLIARPKLIYRHLKGQKVNVPIELKNMRILGPGQKVQNSYLALKNTTRFPFDPKRSATHKLYHETAGVHVYNKTLKNLRYFKNLRYLEGKGTTQFLSAIIKNKPGYFYVDACRVLPGVTQNQANKMLKNTLAGIKIVHSSKNLEKMRKNENISIRIPRLRTTTLPMQINRRRAPKPTPMQINRRRAPRPTPMNINQTLSRISSTRPRAKKTAVTALRKTTRFKK